MKIYHLSHTDLDGYGAQYITNFYFKDVKFLNSNYGREIDDKFAQILAEIGASNDDKNIILITDLNLTLAQCESFTEMIDGKNIKLFK